jgi:hypothetical protein
MGAELAAEWVLAVVMVAAILWVAWEVRQWSEALRENTRVMRTNSRIRKECEATESALADLMSAYLRFHGEEVAE